MRKGALACALAALIAGCGAQTRVVVAAGTTVVDSGFIDLVASSFEESFPHIQLSVVGDATAQVLELGRRGAADVLLTHSPPAEEAFLASEDTTRYVEVFTSRFVLLGPGTERMRLSGLPVVEAMRAIGQGGLPFVSRADGSGTHLAELDLWRSAGIEPAGQPWYIETGQGMGPTLQVADQRMAFTLSELGAFRRAEDVLSLVEVDVNADTALQNPYHATVPARSEVRSEAERFVDWLTSGEGRTAIGTANRSLYGAETIYEVP